MSSFRRLDSHPAYERGSRRASRPCIPREKHHPKTSSTVFSGLLSGAHPAFFVCLLPQGSGAASGPEPTPLSCLHDVHEPSIAQPRQSFQQTRQPKSIVPGPFHIWHHPSTAESNSAPRRRSVNFALICTRRAQSSTSTLFRHSNLRSDLHAVNSLTLSTHAIFTSFPSSLLCIRTKAWALTLPAKRVCKPCSAPAPRSGHLCSRRSETPTPAAKHTQKPLLPRRRICLLPPSLRHTRSNIRLYSARTTLPSCAVLQAHPKRRRRMSVRILPINGTYEL